MDVCRIFVHILNKLACMYVWQSIFVEAVAFTELLWEMLDDYNMVLRLSTQ